MLLTPKNKKDAEQMGSKLEDYFAIQECKSLNAPSMFTNCLFDEKSLKSFCK